MSISMNEKMQKNEAVVAEVSRQSITTALHNLARQAVYNDYARELLLSVEDEYRELVEFVGERRVAEHAADELMKKSYDRGLEARNGD